MAGSLRLSENQFYLAGPVTEGHKHARMNSPYSQIIDTELLAHLGFEPRPFV